VRHAHASKVRITLARIASGVAFTVGDNGRGFSPSSPPREGRRGLRNMAECARLVVGRLDVQARQGHATRVRIELPG
jgi:signal transduction histidine kinase